MLDSKLIKIQGKELNNCFINCKIPNTITDGRLMADNDKYLIMAWNNKPGAINVVNPDNPCDLENYIDTFNVQDSNILDMEFSPFNSDIFYFSNENNYIFEGKITQDNKLITDYYKFHKDKVYFINSNPVASNVICSGTSTSEIHIWDSIQFKMQTQFKFLNNINSILWNPNGSLIGISGKKYLLTLIDPRNSEIIYGEKINNEINSNSKLVWLNENSLATINYNIKEKQFNLSLYDIRNNLINPFSNINIGTKGSFLTPFADPELYLIYLTEKNSNLIKYFDYSNGSVKKCGEFKTSEESIFSMQLNRKYLKKNNQEIDKFLRYTKKNKIFYVSFNIDNKLIYPSEKLLNPQMTSEEWFEEKRVIQLNINKNKIKKNNNNNININKTEINNKRVEQNHIEILNSSIIELKNVIKTINEGKSEIIKEKEKEKNKFINEIDLKNKYIKSLEEKIKDLEDKLNINYIEEIKLEYENKISFLKEELKQNEKVINEKIEVIKNQYKELLNQELKKTVKRLIKAAGTNLKNFNDKYNNIYLAKEKELILKCNEIEKLNIKIKGKEIYYNKLEEENKKLKEEISRFPPSLLQNEYIILLIIMTKDEKVMFPLMCKNTDKLNKIKEIFFKEFPEYSDNNGNFYCHNNLLTIDKSLQECNIKNNDIIIFESE